MPCPPRNQHPHVAVVAKTRSARSPQAETLPGLVTSHRPHTRATRSTHQQRAHSSQRAWQGDSRGGHVAAVLDCKRRPSPPCLSCTCPREVTVAHSFTRPPLLLRAPTKSQDVRGDPGGRSVPAPLQPTFSWGLDHTQVSAPVRLQLCQAPPETTGPGKRGRGAGVQWGWGAQAQARAEGAPLKEDGCRQCPGPCLLPPAGEGLRLWQSCLKSPRHSSSGWAPKELPLLRTSMAPASGPKGRASRACSDCGPTVLSFPRAASPQPAPSYIPILLWKEFFPQSENTKVRAVGCVAPDLCGPVTGARLSTLTAGAWGAYKYPPAGSAGRGTRQHRSTRNPQDQDQRQDGTLGDILLPSTGCREEQEPCFRIS